MFFDQSWLCSFWDSRFGCFVSDLSWKSVFFESTVIRNMFQVRCRVVSNLAMEISLRVTYKPDTKAITWQFQICPFKEKPGVIRTWIWSWSLWKWNRQIDMLDIWFYMQVYIWMCNIIFLYLWCIDKSIYLYRQYIVCFCWHGKVSQMQQPIAACSALRIWDIILYQSPGEIRRKDDMVIFSTDLWGLVCGNPWNSNFAKSWK